MKYILSFILILRMIEGLEGNHGVLGMSKLSKLSSLSRDSPKEYFNLFKKSYNKKNKPHLSALQNFDLKKKVLSMFSCYFLHFCI